MSMGADIKIFLDSLGWTIYYLAYFITRKSLTGESISLDEFMRGHGYHPIEKHWLGTTYGKD